MHQIPTTSAAVLTYHSQNVGGDRSAVNDHEALRADLAALLDAGHRFAPLEQVAANLAEGRDPGGVICLTFDDGCDFDVRDIDVPGIGPQRALLGILEDAMAGRDGGVPGLHATSFVIASMTARRVIDRRSLFGEGWMSDDWWYDADHHPLMAIGNHGWDHHHPDLDPDDPRRGGFTHLDRPSDCELQVVRAAELIESRTGRWPSLFAYPFGESSEYLRKTWFPAHLSTHRCLAAVGTRPGFMRGDSDRWDLPRFVCGRDWTSPEELLVLLGGEKAD